MLVFVVIIAIVGGLTLRSAVQVSSALPDVGKDEQGDDPWTEPIGVEKVGDLVVAHIPDCAAGPVVRIALWDEASKPYWEVHGPPTPMATFVVGAAPKGFTVDTPLDAPKPGAVLRLVIIRKVKGAAGVRFQSTDLRSKRVASLLPIQRFTIDGFQTADVCGAKDKAKTKIGADTGVSTVTTTTVLGG